ncbi:hypothetical protein DXG01_013368 [Tephrocybe rancida]|nr:hypothetical protein DXG01_013368 [Tephrocybe rancida]
MTPTTQDDENPFEFPGFGLPLNYSPGDGFRLFRNALDQENLKHGRSQLPLTTLREFVMLNFMDMVFDESITSKWKQEALSEKVVDITQAMLDWCIAELQYKTKGFRKTGAVSVYNGDVVKSDTIISSELKAALRVAVAPLEQVPEHAKDWHPKSNGMVLDLVHPSLFPLIYGRTRILPNDVVGLDDCVKRSGEGVVVPVPPEDENGLKRSSSPVLWFWMPNPSTPFSRHFQWLPCDVDISDPTQVKIKSYVNNLHPQTHKALYSVIEEIISHAIPLWNMSLSPLKDPGFRYNRIQYTECVYDPDPENGPETDGPQRGDYEDEDDFWEQRDSWYEDTRVVVRPEPGTFEPPAYNDNLVGAALVGKEAAAVELRRDFAKRGLQIIVKLANIHLTPKEPAYEGGSWHVEGQLMSPIKTTVGYSQDHHDWLHVIFGCEQDEPGVQDSGTVGTPEGRLLAWPNVLQHRVEPFGLIDPDKPGHRKILALFLVDPNIRIVSTSSVPCQQRDWWSTELRKDVAIPKLPFEVQDRIFEDVEEFPIDLEEAKRLRLELMDERSEFVQQYDNAFHQHRFSLCEH